MKKWLLTLFVFCLLSLASIYVFIPNQLIFSTRIILPANVNATNRWLASQRQWNQWWPGKKLNAVDSANVFQQFNYQANAQMMENLSIRIYNDKRSVQTILFLIPYGSDSAIADWKGRITTGLNPMEKVSGFLQAKALEKNMHEILKSLNSFLQKKKNLYGIEIEQQKVTDTLLITTKGITNSFPSTTFVYNLIDKLKEFAVKEKIQETSYPMLHIDSIGKNNYQVQVAIPVNKEVPGTQTIYFKRMVPGNILVTEVKGGNLTIQQAYNALENYRHDYQKNSPAIPFESLITNRQQESDTANWVTKIYYPVY